MGCNIRYIDDGNEDLIALQTFVRNSLVPDAEEVFDLLRQGYGIYAIANELRADVPDVRDVIVEHGWAALLKYGNKNTKTKYEVYKNVR